MSLNIQGIGEVIMAMVVVILFIPVIMYFFPESDVSFALETAESIAKTTKYIDSAEEGICRDLEIEIPKQYQIDKYDDILSVEDEDTSRKKINVPQDLVFGPDPHNKFASDGNFPINKDFKEDIHEKICICKHKGQNLIFPQPRVFGVIDTCVSVLD